MAGGWTRLAEGHDLHSAAGEVGLLMKLQEAWGTEQQVGGVRATSRRDGVVIALYSSLGGRGKMHHPKRESCH